MPDHGSLGSMLQGVSQQPAHIRGDGQVTEQINLVSDVVRGITSRPAASLLSMNNSMPRGLNFKTIRIADENFQIAFSGGRLFVLDDQGVPQTLLVDGLSYIGDDMTFYSYDDNIYLVNRDRVVQTLPPQPDLIAEVEQDVGLVTCLGGLFNHEYRVQVEYPDGYVAVGLYQTPFGTEDGDALKTSSTYIAEQLASSLENGSSVTDYVINGTVLGSDYNRLTPAQKIAYERQGLNDDPDDIGDHDGEPRFSITDGLRQGTTVEVANSVISIRGLPGIRITVADGSGGDTIVSQTSVTKSTQELSEYAPHGTLTKVIGLDGTEDDFWMRFEVEGETTVGAGFGSEGLWREWYDPREVTEFDPTTMPHIIEKTDVGFLLRPAEWQGRRTGDDATNPMPSFVGQAIRDVNGMQSRLMFIAGPNAIMSRTNIPTDFFAQSVVAETATDPVDIISTSENEFTLDWIIPFDRDIVIFSQNAQFLISGANGITPNNASMVETTNYEVDADTKPVTTGRTVLFPFPSGKFAGVKEFYSINTEDANTSVDITKIQDEYIPGRIVDMESSTNFSMVIVRADEKPEELYIHQYYWDGSSKAQTAWYKWVMPYPVVHTYFYGGDIWVMMHSPILGYIQTVMDVDTPEDAGIDYHATFDLKQTVKPVGGEVTLPFGNANFVQGTGCVNPGELIKFSVRTVNHREYVYSFNTDVCPTGASLISGVPYTEALTPTMPFYRDREGKAQRLSKLVVTDFVVHYEDSGPLSSTMRSRYRHDVTTLDNAEVHTFQDPDDSNRSGVRTGEWHIPWGERSDWSELTVSSYDARPITIIDVEWIGQPLTRGRRV